MPELALKPAALALLRDDPARHSESPPRELLMAMTQLAAACWQARMTQPAADFLAYVLQEPDLPSDIRALADERFAELESRACPRVIADAIAYAADLDMPAMLDYARDILRSHIMPSSGATGLTMPARR